MFCEGLDYKATQQGVVDGLITPFVNFFFEQLYEVTPYVSKLNVPFFFRALMINADYYDNLPDDLSITFDQDVEETIVFADQGIEELENIIVTENLIEKGAEVVLLDDDEFLAFAEATRPVVEANIDLVGIDFYDAAMKELGRKYNI